MTKTERIRVTGNPITLQDIADHCHVSKCTVSLALRGRPPISKETREMILSTAAALGYEPGLHDGARRLALHKQGKTLSNRIIALFLPIATQSEGFFFQLVNSILGELMREEYGLLTLYSPSYEHATQDSPLWSIFTRGNVDGVITTHVVTDRLISLLRANPGFKDRPLVRIINTLPQDASVQTDEHAVGYEIARHLLELGHRHLLQFIFAHAIPHEVQRRIDGICTALEERGLAPTDHLVLYPMDTVWNKPSTAPRTLTNPPHMDLLSPPGRAFVSFLASHPEVTAILGLNDASALHAWHALHLAGYRIPDDFSLIGYDDTDPMLNVGNQNTLSSVQIPLREIGKEAASLCVRLVTNPTMQRQTITLPSTFFPRASIGPAPVTASRRLSDH